MRKIITLIRAHGLLNRAHGLLNRAHDLVIRAHDLVIRAHGLVIRAHGLTRLNNYFPHGTAGAPYVTKDSRNNRIRIQTSIQWSPGSFGTHRVSPVSDTVCSLW